MNAILFRVPDRAADQFQRQVIIKSYRATDKARQPPAWLRQLHHHLPCDEFYSRLNRG